jgi:hypothetical protein
MNITTKSLLLDCDLMQITFQFRTFVPTGNFPKGLGTGHVSLEPSLLTAIKLTPTSYFQGQLSYWFPIGGDTAFQGNVFHYHMSYNRLLWACGHNIQLIGTAELSGWEFLNGSYTDPVTGLALRARDVGTVVSAGPGVRLSICNIIDFGVGSAFALTGDRLAAELIRAEFRWRF